MTPIDNAVSAIPTTEGSGFSRCQNVHSASTAMNAASRNRDTPTSLRALRSRSSISTWFVAFRSAVRRHRSTAPDELSTKLSMPNPRRATLPAASAARTAMTPSMTFHPTVTYSRVEARAKARLRRAVDCKSVPGGAMSILASLSNGP